MTYEDIKFIQNDIHENNRKGVTFSREVFDAMVDFIDSQEAWINKSTNMFFEEMAVCEIEVITSFTEILKERAANYMNEGYIDAFTIDKLAEEFLKNSRKRNDNDA
jgi:SAM-dependent MidA family methyltransferase